MEKYTKEPLKMHLQFFADESTNENTEDENTENQDEETQDNATFTQSEVDSQISKAVDSALKKQQAKLEKDKQKAIDDAKNEAEQYAKLTAKEKEDAEHQKRVKALEDRERELNNRELLSQIESDLKENELPTSFSEALLSIQDNEKIKESITDIKKQFDEAVNAKVKEALRQDTPRTGVGIKNQNKMPSIADMAAKARVIKN